MGPRCLDEPAGRQVRARSPAGAQQAVQRLGAAAGAQGGVDDGEGVDSTDQPVRAGFQQNDLLDPAEAVGAAPQMNAQPS